MTHLLVVDDDTRFARAISIGLRARGYAVDWAASGHDGLTIAARLHPDLVLLDLGLPDIDGIDVLAALRSWSKVPVIILSARNQEEAKVEALDCGADDYVTKPFGLDELLARVRAALRRGVSSDGNPVIVTEAFSVDLASKQVTDTEGHVIHLTPTEWQVVEVLARHGGKLVPQRMLLQEVWGPQYEKEFDYLRIYLARIRRKLEPNPSRPRYFITEPGMGYRFVTT